MDQRLQAMLRAQLAAQKLADDLNVAYFTHHLSKDSSDRHLTKAMGEFETVVQNMDIVKAMTEAKAGIA